MAASTASGLNGHGNHNIRFRAAKPANPQILRAQSDEGTLSNGQDAVEVGDSTEHTRYDPSLSISIITDIKSGYSTPVPEDAPPSVQSMSSARKQLRAEQRRRIFPTIEYASRVSHFDPNSEYRDFQGFYILFWIALTIMVTTTMLRNIKDTGYPMKVQIWQQMFTSRTWELGVADGLMVASTMVVLPLQKMCRSGLVRWHGLGMAIQSIYQALWFTIWVW